MLSDDIARFYHIQCGHVSSSNQQHLFRNGHQYYLMIPFHHFQHVNIDEVVRMSQHLEQSGLRKVGQFVANNDGQWLTKINDQDVVLITVSSIPTREQQPLATQLEQFHRVGRRFSFQDLSNTPFEKWPEYWAFRIDQLEKWRDVCIEENDGSDFTHWFLTTYPYYMALAENAIQYSVDLRIDEGLQEEPSICHARFNEQQWNSSIQLKKPSDWVIDHPSRDLAEWLRTIVLSREDYQKVIPSLIDHYQNTQTLTPYSVNLIFSRLLFPIHYIETIEEYYVNKDERTRNDINKRLITMLNKSRVYENFLYNLPSLFDQKIKTISWLLDKRPYA